MKLEVRKRAEEGWAIAWLFSEDFQDEEPTLWQGGTALGNAPIIGVSASGCQ
jgi:hypothetical protein